MLKVTLVKSLIGNTPANRATVHALGLRKIGQSNTFEPTAPILGMIHKVKHLLMVEELDGGSKTRRRQGKKVLTATAPAAKASEDKPKKAAAKKSAKADDASGDVKSDAKPKTTRKKKTEEN